jgi:hypothetical protein
MCRRIAKATSGLTALLLIGMVGCTNLDVTNPNAPDAARALSTPGDVESLIAGAMSRWMNVSSYNSFTMFFSNASGEHVQPWANSGSEVFARIPRIPTANIAGGSQVSNIIYAWYEAYGAIAAVRDGLKQIADGSVDLDQLSPNGNVRAQAYGKFMQGLAHATIATMYDSGFVYDETSDPTAVKLQGYQDVMNAALGYFDQAATLAGSASFTLPASWMSQPVTSATLVQLAHSMAARYRAAVARTKAERQAVNWTQVVADANAGVTADWMVTQDCNTRYFCQTTDEGMGYRIAIGWQEQNNWYMGMADTSGAYQAWIATPLLDKQPFIFHTPDTRWPSGADEATQRANPGEYYVLAANDQGVWARPDRGTWRWSYYEQDYEPWFTEWNVDWAATVPWIRVEELNALKAEAAYYAGQFQTVADFVNATRTTHGLLATDAAGTNTNCVPRLPDGTCGNLWEMFKWEKRLETQFSGPLTIGWYLDGRGWGDLIKGTLLQLPVPYKEMQLLQETPYNFGGVNDPVNGAPVQPNGDTYNFCGLAPGTC